MTTLKEAFYRACGGPSAWRRGATMVEMLIAVSIFSIGVVGLISTFANVEKAVQTSKGHSLANNIAQEQMQILMEANYLQLVPTTSPSYLATVSPVVAYDTTYYPPQSVLEGSINFTRYTYIQVVDGSTGQLTVLDPTTPDTGMRMITVSVVWTIGGVSQVYQLSSVLANPQTVLSNVAISGTITNASTSQPISGAMVDVAENVGWRGTTNSSGKYGFSMSFGNYTLSASAPGYFPAVMPISVAPQTAQVQNFSLQPMSSGTVTGTVYFPYNDIMVTQVVSSTMVPVLASPGTYQDVEYMELFNPTTSPIVLDGYYGCGPEIGYYQGWNSNWIYGGCWSQYGNYLTASPSNWTIPANSYFLLANTGTFVLNGTSITADAYYYNATVSTALPDLIPAGVSGGYGWGIIFYYNQSSNYQTWDYITNQISYSNNSSPNGYSPGYASGHSIPLPDGLLRGDQIVRVSSPGYVSVSTTTHYARAYASTDTWQNFTWNPAATPEGYALSPTIFTSTKPFYMPFTTHSGTFTAVSGVPAIGAIITANDGLAGFSTATVSVSTYSVFPSSQPYATFTLVSVATGTWSVFIDSLPWTQEVDSVTVSTNGSWVPILSAVSSPAWSPPGYSPIVMSSTTNVGYIAGYVWNVYNQVISPSVEVTVPNGSTYVNSSGRYLLRTTSGTYTVTANPSNLVPQYVYSAQNNVSVTQGKVTDNVNFILSQGGQLTAYMTKDGTNPLPGIEVVANDQNGITRADVISGSNGVATMVNLATGTYTVVPELSPLVDATPYSMSAALTTAGATIFVGTFTISGALGAITGSVTASGKAITTGVLVLVSTAALGASPPAISSATTTAYYQASSQENGTYSVAVRGSTTTTYNVAAYYTTYNGQTTVTTYKSQSGVSVSVNGTTSGVNFAW